MDRTESTLAKEFLEYSYENTLQILHNKYKSSKYWFDNGIMHSIFIIRPSLKSDDVSLYAKYLECDSNGNLSDCNSKSYSLTK